MPAIDAFQTERLVAERLGPEHLSEYRELYGDPRVMAILSANGASPAESEIASRLREAAEHWNRQGYGFWIFRHAGDGRFVGRAGLRKGLADDRDEVELAYALMPEFWNQGLATEMAPAILRIAFHELGLPDVVCFTLPTNRASQRVMEKAGFMYEKEILHAGLPHVLYRRTADTIA